MAWRLLGSAQSLKTAFFIFLYIGAIYVIGLCVRELSDRHKFLSSTQKLAVSTNNLTKLRQPSEWRIPSNATVRFASPTVNRTTTGPPLNLRAIYYGRVDKTPNTRIRLTNLSLWNDFSWVVNPSRNIMYTHQHFLNGQIHELTGHRKNKMFYAATVKRLRAILVPATLPLPPPSKQRERACFSPQPVWLHSYHTIREAVRMVNETLWRGHVHYFLTYGSFLGSYRYHTSIPWDDDIDFQVHHRQKPRVIRLMRDALTRILGHRMRFEDLEKQNGGHMKLGMLCSNLSRPLIHDCQLDFDFFFFDVNPRTGRIEIAEKPVELDTDTFFPVVLRPFMGMLLPTPRNYAKFRRDIVDYDYERFLKEKHPNATYFVGNARLDYCAPTLRERPNMNCAELKLPCTELSHTYPSMHRRRFTTLAPVFQSASDVHTLRNERIDMLAEMTTFGESVLSYFIQLQIN